jgi:predicted transcriptional regulator
MVRADLKGASLAKQNAVADACGVPWSTLRKIVDGDTDEPKYSTVEKLRAYYFSPRQLSEPQQAASEPPGRQMG